MPPSEKARLERLAHRIGEDLAKFARNAMRERAAGLKRRRRSTWDKYAGCVEVTLLPPTNATIRAALRRAKSSRA